MISVIVPVRNEEQGLAQMLISLREILSTLEGSPEIVVVDDGSIDRSGRVAQEHGVVLRTHQISHGYGQAIRTGLAAAKHDLIGLIDGDGSYDPKDFARLIDIHDHYDMIVGARTGREFSKNLAKTLSRKALVCFCEFICGIKINDINSGMRIFRRPVARLFLNHLSYGFSFTTSLTLCMTLNGYRIGYADVNYLPRWGHSKVNHFRDTLRTLQKIFEIFARYNPQKLYLSLILVSVLAFSTFWLAFSMKLISLFTVAYLGLMNLTVSILLGLSFLAVPQLRRMERGDENIETDTKGEVS